jgi:CHAT domain-containing protein/Tfp pilus assembly protein PilF
MTLRFKNSPVLLTLLLISAAFSQPTQNHSIKGLIDKGEDSFRQGNLDEALRSFESALSLSRKENKSHYLMSALRGIARVYYIKGDYPKAMLTYKELLELATESKDRLSVANAITGMGVVHEIQGEYAKALENYQAANRIMLELSDRSGMVMTLNNIGLLLYHQGNYSESLNFLEQALSISRELDDPVRLSQVYNQLGLTYKSLGLFKQSLETFEAALKITESTGHRDGISRILNNIGSVYFSYSDYKRALRYYYRSLKISESIGNRSGVAYIYNNIGSIYEAQGNYDQALTFYEKSLSLKREIGDKPFISLTLNNIGTIYVIKREYRKAISYFNESLKVAEDIGDKNGIANAQSSIAHLYELEGRITEAKDFYNRSLLIHEKSGNQPGVAQIHGSLGDLYFKTGDLVRAAEHVSRSSNMASYIGLPALLWQSKTIEGKIALSQKEFKKAEQSFNLAIETIEKLRDQIAGDEQEQQRFFENKVGPYHGMVQLMVLQQKLPEALKFVERSKARVLLDIMRDGKQMITKSMSASELQEEQRLNSLLVSLNTQLFREKQRAAPDNQRVRELTNNLDAARKSHEAFLNHLYVTHPTLRIQRGQTEIDLEKVQIPDEKSMFLNFLVMENETLLFLVDKRGEKLNIKLHRINYPRKKLNLSINDLNRSISERRPDFRTKAEELYNQLIRPVEGELRSKTSLYIIPDTCLWELPFQALVDGQGDYLVERFSISYIPSLHVLTEIRKVRPAESRQTLLAFGNPDFQIPENIVGSVQLGAIPETEVLVKRLGTLYNRFGSRVYTRAEATELRAKRESSGFRILHFATHGIIDHQNPLYSHLLLSQSDSREDGLLESREVMDLDLKAELAILSACQTAKGRIGEGEGIVGIMWAMFVAGCPSTVVSQWSVDSAGTTELMLEFHQNLLRPRLSKSEALRRASLKLLANSNYRHPFYWAPFVLVGNPN